MPSSDPNAVSTRRRKLLAAVGVCGLAGIGTVSGRRYFADESEAVERTQQLTVDDEFDIDESTLEPAGEDGPDSEGVSQQCDPDPDRLSSASHRANLTMIGAWTDHYDLWGDREADENGVHVQNSIVVEKAPERVDGSLLYGVRIHSQCHVESERFARYRLQRIENELTVDPAIEIRSVLPSRPIRPDDGVCSLTVMTELPSGWNAGYEQDWWTNDGTLEAEHVDTTVTVSFDGDVSRSASLKGLLEIRSERPLAEFDDPFTWTVRSEATRRDW